MSLFRRVSNLFFRSQVEQEINAELRSHIEMRIADNIAAGMPLEEARRDALLRFGNPTVMKERVAAMDAALVLSNIWADVKLSLRQLRKNPGFTFAAQLLRWAQVLPSSPGRRDVRTDSLGGGDDELLSRDRRKDCAWS